MKLEFVPILFFRSCENFGSFTLQKQKHTNYYKITKHQEWGRLNINRTQFRC